jgi:hypothetical protein
VVVGIHVRYGGVEFATNAESERVFKHKEERSRLDAFNNQYVHFPDAYSSTVVDCCCLMVGHDAVIVKNEKKGLTCTPSPRADEQAAEGARDDGQAAERD